MSSNLTVEPPDDWPYADETAVCAACGSASERHLVVASLGLVWGGAMDGGVPPTEVGDYCGTLEFRCCGDCWTEKGIDALEDAQTLVDWDARAGGGRPLALDDAKVAAAAELDATRVAVADCWPIDRATPELEHVRAQDDAVESLLKSWFDE